MKKLLFSLVPGGLFAILAPLSFYLLSPNNRILNHWKNILVPMVFTLTIFFILYGISYLITRSVFPASVISVIMVIGIFYVWQIALGLAVLTLVCIAVFPLLHRKLSFLRVHTLLTILSVVITFFYSAQFVSFIASLPTNSIQTMIEPVIASEIGHVDAKSKPDIYYIILDSYAREDLLDTVYGYDNSEFILGLQGLNFIVADGSRSNYGFTELSLTSTLNMQYLDEIGSTLKGTDNWWLTMDALHHSQVRQFLEAQGYRTVFTASGFDYTDIRDGDEYIKPFPIMLNNFEADFLRYTGFASLGDMGHLVSYPSYSTYRQVILSAFGVLPKIASEPGPKFVFVHITVPHPPFVFDEAGHPLNPKASFTLLDNMRKIMDEATYKASYVAELKYINRLTLQTLQAVLANSATPPVIILQGDHGPGLYLGETAAATCLYERFSILNAYYLPGIEPASIPRDSTPVNSFRMVFNEYFSTAFPLLQNQSYFTSFSHFYDFQDVGHEIGSTCTQP